MTKLLLLSLLFPILSFGQTINTTEKSGERNIYNDAIKHFITLASKSDKSSIDTLLIFKDDLITDSLKATILKTNIILLDSIQISDRLRGDNSFIANKLFPLSFDNGHFYINIVPFKVHREIDEIMLENTGTCVVSYIYDTNQKGFIFYRSACDGF